MAQEAEIGGCYDNFKMLCEAHGLREIDITTKRRSNFKEKRAIAKRLRLMGYSYPCIGRVMNRYHTAVMAMVKK